MRLTADLKLTRGVFELHAQLDFPLTGLTALFGRSGSGKTSLLRAIAGLERPEGRLQIGGSEWQNLKRSMPADRRHVGYIFQEADLFAHLNVEKNLLYGYKRRAIAQRRFAPDQIIDLLKITHLLARRTENLSGGERQLVALGRALLSSPELLLMDEPLGALDISARAGIYPLLGHIADTMGIPILYVSHGLDEVARLADQMILINAGKITATGRTADMLTRLDLPLAKSPEAEVVIPGTVTSHDEKWQLSEIAFAGGKFLVPRIAKAPGEKVRLRVAASDVSVSLSHPADTSIVNIFPARIAELAEEGALLLLKLDLNGLPVLARITRLSGNTLAVKTGAEVFAQIKGAAVLV
jgi:molybdate transport system ATP-binding protein